MHYEPLEEIDYEALDDLPIHEHIEWQFLEENSLTPTPTEPVFYS